MPKFEAKKGDFAKILQELAGLRPPSLPTPSSLEMVSSGMSRLEFDQCLLISDMMIHFWRSALYVPIKPKCFCPSFFVSKRISCDFSEGSVGLLFL